MTQANGFITLFLRRPIFAFVVAILMILAGAAAWLGLEVRELPSVERPVLTVTTPYTGASPETIDQEITAPVEAALGRLEGLISVSSSSRFGRSRITLEFSDTTNIDTATTDARDALARLTNLPEEADDPTVVKADADAQPILRLSVTSSTRTPEDLTQLVTTTISDRMLAIPGVADLQLFGDRTKLFRVDVDLRQLSARGLSLADLQAALRTAPFDAATGSVDTQGTQLTVRTQSVLAAPALLEDLLLAPNIRLGDVAQVSLGPSPDTTLLRANGVTGLGLGLIRQPGSNTLTISTRAQTEVENLNAVLPEDVTVTITSDDAVFINSALTEVLKTLAMAMAIVVAVLALFLQNPRTLLIPAITMPIALIVTLAGLYFAGFSLNILTLLAFVLATGLVVDDAIVVVENISRLHKKGYKPFAAAALGTQQVFFAVITTTITLAAVFIPLSFLPGQAGGLFQEFGFTLAIAVGASSLVALVLCPVLAAFLLTTPTREYSPD